MAFVLIFILWNITSPLQNITFFSQLKQVSEATDSNLYSVPSYFLYPKFQTKAGCSVYVRNDITCSCAHHLNSSEFSIIWTKLKCYSIAKYICAVYLSPDSTDYVRFFDYLTSKVEHILAQ